jgi:hypothetical protein
MLFLHVVDKVVATNALQGPTPHNLLGSPRLFITSTTPVESLRIQLLSQGTSAFWSIDTQRSLTVGNIALKKEHNHLETLVRELELAAQINLGLIGFLENLDNNKSIRTKFLVLYLEKKTIENLP